MSRVFSPFRARVSSSLARTIDHSVRPLDQFRGRRGSIARTIGG
jgi:hypothetical protein